MAADIPKTYISLQFFLYMKQTKQPCYEIHLFAYTGLFKMSVGVLTTCHTQYT